MRRSTRQSYLAKLRAAWGECPMGARGVHFMRIPPNGSHNEHSSEVVCVHCSGTFRLPHGPLRRAAAEQGWLAVHL
jgi:hypothetical protein